MDMELFTKYNRKNIQDRQTDTLIGLSKGLLADGVINQKEAEYLHNWLVQNRQSSDNPMIQNLLERIGIMLEDGVLDEEESHELLALLGSLTGESGAIGEVAETTTLPIDLPMPLINFNRSTFMFTGTFVYGTRKQCEEATESLNGLNAKSLNKNVNYLVLGTYVTDSWAHESFGRKIEKAIKYRKEGVPLAIITETHWLSERERCKGSD
jgi:NAD-dependent DNA ligase